MNEDGRENFAKTTDLVVATDFCTVPRFTACTGLFFAPQTPS